MKTTCALCGGRRTLRTTSGEEEECFACEGWGSIDTTSAELPERKQAALPGAQK